MIRKHLNSLGLPPKDQKWVRLAIGCDGRVLVSNDIDFFDPAKKSASAAAKAAVKRSGKGPCSKALQKVYGLQVKLLEDFL